MLRKKPGPMRRVLLVECGSLFDEGLATRLRGERDLQVSSVACADEAAFLREVSRTQPDVILVNEAGTLDATRIFRLLKDVQPPVALCVIVVRRDDNTIDLYERQTVIANHLDKLLELIRQSKAITRSQSNS